MHIPKQNSIPMHAIKRHAKGMYHTKVQLAWIDMEEKGSRIVKTRSFNEDNEHELDGGSRGVQRRMRTREEGKTKGVRKNERKR